MLFAKDLQQGFHFMKTKIITFPILSHNECKNYFPSQPNENITFSKSFSTKSYKENTSTKNQKLLIDLPVQDIMNYLIAFFHLSLISNSS